MQQKAWSSTSGTSATDPEQHLRVAAIGDSGWRKSSTHTHLSSLLGCAETPGLLAWALPYCPGGDLNELRHVQPDRIFLSAPQLGCAGPPPPLPPPLSRLCSVEGGEGRAGPPPPLRFLSGGRRGKQATGSFFLVSGRVGPTQVPQVSMARVGEKKRPFLAETLSKL
jgi:hypothetical protein